MISAHADYRRNDYRFQEKQSREMEDAPWEQRSNSIRAWGKDLMALVYTIIFVGACTIMIALGAAYLHLHGGR